MFGSKLQDKREGAGASVNVERITTGVLKDITYITPKLVWQGVREISSGENAVQQVNPQQGQSLSDVDNATLRRGFDVR